MANNSYLQSQEILKRCFVNVTGKLKSSGGTYTTQDYLNAVYDDANDSLRIAVDGSSLSGNYWGEPVGSVDELPEGASEGTITPVLTSNSLSFYYYDGEKWVPLLSSESYLTVEERQFLAWGIENKEELEFYIDHKNEIEGMLNTEFAVKVITIELPKVIENSNVVPVNIDVNGNIQNIVDADDSDGDETTHYKIDVNGYVIGIETYENENSILTDRYYTKEVYEKNQGEYGVTHIYMTTEEYDYFSNLGNGRNILKIAYLESAFGSDVIVKKASVSVPGDFEQGVIMTNGSASVVETSNVDEITHYRYRIDGYVMSVETYQSNASLKTEECHPDIVDYNEGENNSMGYTDFYITKEAYNTIKSLQVGKNVIEVYYLYQTK